MQARDIMTTPVVTAELETPVIEIAKRLMERRISAVPVVDADGSVVGIVSEGDLMRWPQSGGQRHTSWWLEMITASQESAREYIKSHGRIARDVMTGNPITVEEDASLEEIATLLEKHRIKRVPVLREGKLVGIVSRANLLQGIVARQRAPQGSADDRVIRQQVTEAIRNCGVDSQFVNIQVAAGIVSLWGATNSEVERKAIVLAAQAVPGVKHVDSHLGVFPAMVRATMGAE
jgi:CBS domain-containing protein